MFVPIKVTTDYKLMQSTITLPKLLLFLKKYEISVCGICDDNLFGAVEFYFSLKKNNIKPLIGLEINYQNLPLYLYAIDYEGYQFLLKIHTLKEQRDLVEDDFLGKEHKWNVILPFQYLSVYEKIKTIFSNLFIGYTSEYEKNMAYTITSNVVFCPDLRIFWKKENDVLTLLKAIDENVSFKMFGKENYEKNSFEYYIHESIRDDKTKDFINSCNVIFKEHVNYIPIFNDSLDSTVYLRSLAKKGLLKRLRGLLNKKYEERLDYELSVIIKMGFQDYFLIVYDYVRFAKQNGILVGAGRGSAVGSLVSYCLGITDVDPMEYGLLFERFLNEERVTMPDIDIDFEESRRDEVIDYVKSKYGREKTAKIIAFSTLKCKLAVRCVGKCLDINQKVIDAFCNLLDAKISLKDNLKNKEVEYYVLNNDEIKTIFHYASLIEGLRKNTTIHAAGVVISNEPLDTIIPIHFSGSDILTGCTMEYLEELGLLKMDFLSITNLTIMKNILDLIEKNTGKKEDINKILLNDKKVMELFSNAQTNGIFQFESEGMKSFLRKLRPQNFLDLVAAIALYRPGPMDNIDVYVNRKDGKEKVVYIHPDLEPILKETYGIAIYQEQIMQILVKIGGFSFAEADIIRRAMSKKKKDVIIKYQDKFILCAQKRGYEKKIAEDIFQFILPFANYGFNKSHSVGYALFGYQMGYLKCYYKVYYIANILNMNTSSIAKTKEYLSLAKKEGIKILPPDINKSTDVYGIESGSLRLPFTVIKGLGDEAAKSIILNRQDENYKDFFDFISKNYGRSVTKKTLELLIMAGAFDLFYENHNTLKNNIDMISNYAKLQFGIEDDYVLKPVLKKYDPPTEDELRKEEYEVFGFYISNHPASQYIDNSLMKLKMISQFYGKHIKCVVLLERVKEITTKNGDKMAFLTVSDETDIGNFVVFASLMKDFYNMKIGDLMLIEGRVARRFLEYQVNINKIEKIGG